MPAHKTSPHKTVPQKTVTEKALCYIVRDGRLLVFRHTGHSCERVGIQVPAGTVRPDETPEEAALREAQEETGFTGFSIVRKLGEVTYDITPYRFEIQRRHVFHVRLAEPTPPRWAGRELHDGQGDPTDFECFWIPLEDGHVLQSGQGALLGALYD
ncbi:hypothetical protein Acsp03_40840 [Actinomadura sp. NBRC 104412]|uniref:NUDIX hydrolase n=1 Tax=Actinomadura sp. NBRC 104412 TaxID=3032203 RepID=UPI0024A439C1|nr:NUDIX domain-containing protein [Actinomadura sp. NBRC 104412]GLZ06618.1 hypothetical protein Acsp03_40840 [Actinomadura sp. NBRC 104412]